MTSSRLDALGSAVDVGVDLQGNLSGPKALIKTGNAWYYTLLVATTTVQPAEANALPYPIWLPAGITIDRLGVEITTAGSAGAKVRPVVWKDAGGYPGALLVDGGQIDGTQTPNSYEVTVSAPTTASGLYWFAAPVQGTATTRPTLRALNASPLPGGTVLQTSFTSFPSSGGFGNYNVGSVSGVPPDPFGTPPFSIGSAASTPRVFFRVT